jgi:hypothetical protein
VKARGGNDPRSGGSLRHQGAAGAPVQPIADRRDTDVMDTDEGERQRIGHRAEIVAGVICSGESLGGG